MSALNKYYADLKCLKANKPTIFPKGSAINNDTVALRLHVNGVRSRRVVMLHW